MRYGVTLSLNNGQSAANLSKQWKEVQRLSYKGVEFKRTRNIGHLQKEDEDIVSSHMKV